MLLTFLVFVLFMLGYFLFGYKGKERVNFLLLGESGPGHSGATLTDTVIFASVSTKGTVLLSLPRDLWYQPWQTKINSLYFYGQEKGDGFGWTKGVLAEVTGQQIDNVLLVDFRVFEDLVNLVGGVDVVVERSFDDFFYPIAGKEDDSCGGDPKYQCRYEHIRFEAGRQHLDGEQALKFVRSRNAEGEEGTDSARSARQQKVLSALKDRFFSPEILFSPQKIKKLEEIFKNRIKTDMANDELLALGKIFLLSEARQFQSFILDSWQDQKGLITNPKNHPSGQWVLIPRDSSWQEIHGFINCLLYQEDKSSCSQTQRQPPLKP